MTAPTFRLASGMLAADALDRANKHAAGNMPDVSRIAARQALRYLLDALGIGHSEQALIEVLLNGQEGTGDLTEYELSHLSGEVTIEVNGEPRILPLAELRKLIRKEASWRL